LPILQNRHVPQAKVREIVCWTKLVSASGLYRMRSINPCYRSSEVLSYNASVTILTDADAVAEWHIHCLPQVGIGRERVS